MYRLIFFTLPATVLVLWLAAGQYAEQQRREHREAAMQVARALSLAAQIYAEEHQDRFPPADHWEEALRPYLGAAPLTLPQTQGAHGRRYALNRAVAGRKRSEIPGLPQVILFYESVAPAPNAADDLTSLIPADDPGMLILAYADGHIEDYYPAAARDRVIQSSRDAGKK